jgi:hypothetical protein
MILNTPEQLPLVTMFSIMLTNNPIRTLGFSLYSHIYEGDDHGYCPHKPRYPF